MTSESANQIVAMFKSDIRKIFNFIHSWMDCLSGCNHGCHDNHRDAPPQSTKLQCPFLLPTSWRSTHRRSLSFKQSDLLDSTITADNISTLDILSSQCEERSPFPWWRVAPTNHLLDELSDVVSTDHVTSQTKCDVVSELARLSGQSQLHFQRYC